MREPRANAHRLASVLLSYSEDERVVKALAHYLNYFEPQLSEDMKELSEYISYLESKKE